jgi:hypothetical protein
MAWLLLPAVAVAAALVVAELLARRRPTPTQALALFQRQRPELEAAFRTAAAATGKPRGLVWTGCAFAGEPLLARDRQTGQLVALVLVTIQFEAVAGSDMEGWEAVGRPRHASAVFVCRRGRWTTDGRAVFNLDPDEALRLFSRQYEPLLPDR